MDDRVDSVYVYDLDNDGDMDVLATSTPGEKIVWYANDGTGQFGSQQVVTKLAHNACSICAADLDADADLDVLAAFWTDSKIVLYENDLGGAEGSNPNLKLDN